MPDQLERYVSLFTNLRVDHEGNRPRPHKAVMLLSVMALAESGQLAENRIRYTPELLEIFARFFEIVRAGNDRCTPYNPFFYLKTSGFWHLHPQPGQVVAHGVDGPGHLMEVLSHASLDEELLALVSDRTSREVLRLALIDCYFAAHRQAVLDLCSQEESIGRLERYNESHDSETAERVAEAIRDTAFTRVVRRVYDYTCAMCGVRFVCDDVILVDAAHLIPFAESHDDSPNNGMALCKNHHWLMDRHLISPGPGRGRDYARPIWLVSNILDDRLDGQSRACIEYKHRPVLLPREERHRPSPQAIDWRAERLRQ
jgi:putative restriction endonuclease